MRAAERATAAPQIGGPGTARRAPCSWLRAVPMPQRPRAARPGLGEAPRGAALGGRPSSFGYRLLLGSARA